MSPARKLEAVPSIDIQLFVQTCDSLGGIGAPRCAEFMQLFECKVDISPLSDLDPFGADYYNCQVALYEDLSGRTLDQTINEHTDFEIDRHVFAPNPYANISPADAALHLQRLLKLYREANLSYGAEVLDMGAGWGLSSEICAYLGCKVTAVDVNHHFVELIRRRTERSGLSIIPQQSSFDDFHSDNKFDFISFYECLHHATKPWELITRLAGLLKEGGKIGFAGEPINEFWWPHWGLRLDPLSIYCIRKFGWFESGWSQEFISDCFVQAGLHPQIIDDSDPSIGKVLLGKR